MAQQLKTSEIIVRRNITGKLEAAFGGELSLLPSDLRDVLLDDLATAMIERLRVLRTISETETDLPEASL